MTPRILETCLVTDHVGAFFQKPGQEIEGGGGAEAHRPGHAVIVEREAVVGQVGREVEQVTRPQILTLVGMEFAQDGDGEVLFAFQQTRRVLDLPAAVARRLKQEDVVLIDMRPYGAAARRIGDHQVVTAPARDEVELGEKVLATGPETLHIGNQQGPVGAGQPRKPFGIERSVFDIPVAACDMTADDAAGCLRIGRQTGQIIRVEGIFEPRDRVAHQQRSLLPVVAQEFRRGKPPKEGQRLIRVRSGHPGLSVRGRAGPRSRCRCRESMRAGGPGPLPGCPDAR